MNTFANIIKSARISSGLSKKDFAQRIGCSPISMGYYEAGLRTPPLTKIIKIFKILNIPINLLDSPPCNELPAVPSSPPVATAKE